MDYSTVENLKAIIEESIAKAERGESKLTPEIYNLRGFSTPKIRHLLNNLCSYGNCRYLEIGVWAGSTLLPALWKNGARSQAIDNYSQFDEKETGINAQTTALGLLTKYKDEIGRQGIWGGDCLTLPDEVIKPANVFFYDGAHDEESTFKAISKFGKRCANPFILVVDDWELTGSVSWGTFRALVKAPTEFDAEKLPKDFPALNTWILEKKNGYHEGLFIAIVNPKDLA